MENKKTFQTYLSLLRIVFGLVWVITAAFKWTKPFQTTLYSGYLKPVSSQFSSGGIHAFFGVIYGIMGINPHLSDHVNDMAAQPWAVIVAILETALALAILLGFAQRVAYIGGTVLTFLIWGVAEGFGFPYTSTSTDIGNSVIHCFVLLALLGFTLAVRPQKFNLDVFLAKKISWWKTLGIGNEK